MSPQLQIELTSMLTALYCHNHTGRNPSIVSRESMHKHNFGQAFKLESIVVTLHISSQGHENLINSFLSPNNVSLQVWWRKPQ